LFKLKNGKNIKVSKPESFKYTYGHTIEDIINSDEVA